MRTPEQLAAWLHQQQYGVDDLAAAIREYRDEVLADVEKRLLRLHKGAEYAAVLFPAPSVS
jgi:hypothetical protein